MPPILPHPPLYLSEIRPLDILLLLMGGALWEALARLILLQAKRKPRALRQQERDWEALSYEVQQKRKLGPPAFVECSKLERQLLSLEKDLDATRETRKATLKRMERALLRYGNIIVSLIIFIFYYGVPIVALEPLEQAMGPYASPPLKTMLFPVSYVGIGMRVARWGLAEPTNSIGALVVFWSSQVLCGQAFDAVDAYFV